MEIFGDPGGPKQNERGVGLLAPPPFAEVLQYCYWRYFFVTVFESENSEVLPLASVAVAVMLCPGFTRFWGLKVKEAVPSTPVVTLFSPINVWPSSAFCGLEKN